MQDGGTGEGEEAESRLLLREKSSRKRRTGRSPLKDSEKMWVTATTCLILFLVGSSQALIIVPYFVYHMPYATGDMLWILTKLLVPFNIGASLILINYYKCVTTDAGSVPLEWQPPSQVLSAEEAPRYCRSCKSLKPPRAHHCRTCKRCVLRMDHHCPWIANCVGQRNYASFIRFLAAVDVTCAAHLVLCSLRTADYWWTRHGATWRPPSTTTMVLLVLNFCLCLPTFILVGSFSIYHFWCLCINSTTIEGWEKDKVETMIQKRRIEEVDFPFDLGVLSNIQSVLGKSPLHWCVPSLTQGDGLKFKVAEGIDDIDQYYWPPKDPRREARQQRKRATLSASGPFTYGNGGFNPTLNPSNSSSLRATQSISAVPPWHPDFGKDQEGEDDEDEEEEGETDAAQAAGVDTGESCVPPRRMQANRSTWKEEHDESGEGSNNSSSGEEETAKTMTRSRIRRGSEGYEVRPKRYEVAYAALDDDQDEEGEYDDDEIDQHGFDDYNDEEEEEKEWDWQRRQEEEDKLRRMLEEEMRLSGPTLSHDPPPEWQITPAEQTSDLTLSPSILLPSQVMRRRNQWQQFISEPDTQTPVDPSSSSAS